MDKCDELFTYEPLDFNTSSLRLIEILPASGADDLIQCKIRHATVDVEYVCLSYVWGSGNDTRIININGKSFPVRRNLWEFLKVATRPVEVKERSTSRRYGKFSKEKRYAKESLNFKALWIDALCIDQSNLPERNRQVKQMGSIYRNAQYVIAWLGQDVQTASFLGEEADCNFWELKTFCDNGYWKRAWITQEVFLAQKVYFLSARNALSLNYLVQEASVYMREFTHQTGYQHFQPFYDIRNRHSTFTLLENLWRFRHKQCSDWRDSVYSLLSISEDGAQLDVKYDISKASLALEVMHNIKTRFCLCHAKLAYRALGIEEHDWKSSQDVPFVELRVRALQDNPHDNNNNNHSHRCSRCHYSILNLPPRNRPYCEPYSVYCLACTHTKSRVQPESGLHANGHIVLPSTNEQAPNNQAGKRRRAIWFYSTLNNNVEVEVDHAVKWSSTGLDSTAASEAQDVELDVISVDESRDGVFRISLRTFWMMASVGVETEMRVRREENGEDSGFSEGIEARNPVWRLLD